MRVTTSVSGSRAACHDQRYTKTTVMTMRISYRRAVLVTFGLLSFTSFVQEAQRPPQESAQTPPQRAPEQQQRPSPPPPPSQTGRQPPARPGDDQFIPTEELAADEEVTFPVDI